MTLIGTANPAYRHGHTSNGKFSPEYHSWACMIQRCTNPNLASWRYYGGRGIKVCERWRRFENFLADMGARPIGMSIERIDLDRGYEPGNCCWADNTTQARNSRQAVWVTLDGHTKRLVEWCEELSVSINTVRDRVKFYGMTYEQAIMHRRPKR